MTKAIAKHIRISPQKLRLVADLIRGKHVEKALDILAFCPKRGAQFVRKALNSAIANAENNDAHDIDDLFVTKIFVDEGATLKRFQARARGRGNRILKRSAHLTVEVNPKETAA